VQGDDERREVHRREVGVVVARDGILSGKPPRHRPRPRVARARLADGDRRRNGQGQVRSEQRQQAPVVLDLVDGPADARHPHQQLVTETEEQLVGAPPGQPGERERGPAGELLVHETAHHGVGDGELVVVHAATVGVVSARRNPGWAATAART
jgi:hypothetical protein